MTESRTYSGNGYKATIADPSSITRDECLELARCGAGAWNAWREEYPGESIRDLNIASFAGQHLSQEAIDFSSFKFGGVDFSGSVLGSKQKFRNCSFGRAIFVGARFLHMGYFEGSRFSSSNFDETTFDKFVNFNAAMLGGTTRFNRCRFKGDALFGGAFIAGDGHFDESIFEGDAYFNGTIFGSSVSFECCTFNGKAVFDGRTISNLRTAFSRTKYFEKWSEIERYAEKLETGPAHFNEVGFNGARFLGKASFCGRTFAKRASFDEGRHHLESRSVVVDGREVIEDVYEQRLVRFTRPPEYFDSHFCQQISFDQTEFPSPIGKNEAARCYRVLKQAFASQQATREEQRFFRLEMAEEAKAAEISRNPARWLYGAYRELSDFGFSVRRPLFLFAGALALMMLTHAWQADLHPCLPSAAACNKTGPLIQFAAASALPGFEKFAEPASKQLFGEQLGVWTVLTLLLHKAVSLLALFLIGLALRNLFKMK